MFFSRFAYISIIFSIGVLVSGCGETPEQMLARAQTHVDERNYRVAMVELKALLQDAPDTARARWLLGNIYLDLGNGASAEKELDWARSLGIEDDSVVPLLAQALLLQGKADEVLQLRTTGQLGPLSQAELAGYRGLAYVVKHEMDQAKSSIERAVASAPGSVNVRLAHVKYLIAAGKFSEAETAVSEINELAPNNGRAWSLLGDILSALKNWSGADLAYTKAIEILPISTSELTKRGLVRIANGDVDGAAADAAVLSKRAPTVPAAQFLDGLVRLTQMRYPEAVEALERSYALDDRNLQVIFMLATASMHVGNIERARTLAETAVAAKPGFIPARKLLAAIYLRENKSERAEELVRPIVSASQDDLMAMDMLATSLMQQGEVQEATDLLVRIAAKRVQHPVAQLRAGAGLLAAGRREEGLDVLRGAAKLAPTDSTTSRALIKGMLQSGLRGDALAAAKQFTEQNPVDPAGWNLLGIVYMELADSKEAEQAFNRALSLRPADPSASDKLAILAIQGNDLETARAVLERALVENPNNANLLFRLATVAYAEKDVPESDSLLKRAIVADNAHLSARLALANLLIESKQPENALAVLSDAADREQPAVLAVRARAYLDLGDFSEAKNTLMVLKRQEPDAPGVYAGLAKAYEGLGDFEGLKASLERILELLPGDLNAILAKARLLAMEQRFVEARNLLDEKDVPATDASVLSARVFIERLRGDAGKETALAQQLAGNHPSTMATLTLSSAQVRDGNIEGAESTLENWAAEHPGDLSVMKSLGELYIRSDRPSEALKVFERVIDQYPADVQTLNNLAWYLREGDPKRALVYAEKAQELAPDSVAVLDTYADVLARNGAVDLALLTIDRAVAESEQNPAFKLRRAEILYIVGDRERAVEEAQSVLTAEGPDSVKEKARILLQQWRV